MKDHGKAYFVSQLHLKITADFREKPAHSYSHFSHSVSYIELQSYL